MRAKHQQVGLLRFYCIKKRKGRAPTLAGKLSLRP